MLDTEKLGLSTMVFVGLFLEKAGLYHEARTETFICLEHPIDRSIDISSI